MFNVSGISIDQLAESELDVLKVSNAYCDAVMSYQGAQVLEFYSKVKQQPLLWLSELNSYQAGTAFEEGFLYVFRGLVPTHNMPISLHTALHGT